MRFREWLKAQLKEVSTTTACVAGYARPLGVGVVRRPSNLKKKGKKNDRF